MLLQSSPILCDPMDYSSPGFSVHGILQTRILEWVAISFPRGSSQPRDQTYISYTAGKFFTTEPPGEAHSANTSGRKKGKERAKESKRKEFKYIGRKTYINC